MKDKFFDDKAIKSCMDKAIHENKEGADLFAETYKYLANDYGEKDANVKLWFFLTNYVYTWKEYNESENSSDKNKRPN